jgi:acetoin:2,6-dichlorophenolindophenol oxidoreductase subunit alpha
MNKTLEIFRRTCFNRYFELAVAELHKQKLVKNPIYLSLGGEHVPAAISVEFQGPVFAQHRCHSWFLSFGGDPEGLLKELMGREDGCNRGRGGSASVSIKEKEFFGHSGLLGDQIPIAVGFAHASNRPTIVACGDAAVEEDYALAAFGYAVSKKAPILFIVEDNDLSILTKKNVRRSWDVVEVAKGFGMNAFHCPDDPGIIRMHIESFMHSRRFPGLINISVCRHLWHAGSGCDGPPKWNRFETFKQRAIEYDPSAEKIEQEEKNKVEELCQRLLQR